MPGRFANLEFEHQDEAPAALAAPRENPPRDSGLDLLAQAHEKNHSRQFELALRLYTRALQEDRRLVAAWVGQVQMLVQLDEFHEARVWSDKALEIFRNNGDLLATRAQACIRLRDKPGAYRYSDASLQAPGSSPWRWIVRGEVLLVDGKRQFEDCFQRALLEPAVLWFDRVVIARTLAYHRRAAAAIRYLRAALELDQTQASVWFELAGCQTALGMATAARRSYERCLELSPDFAPGLQGLVRLSTASPVAWLRGLWGRWRRR